MLLVEYTVLDKVKIIREGTGASKKLRIRGPFQKMDEVNNNGRIYPGPILESQVAALQDKIKERSLVGALDHPPNNEIYLSQASHLVTKLWVEGKTVMGEAEILSTPSGKIVEALLNDGVKIGISSRGLGTISEGKTAKVVNDDYKLLTFDLVSDPSTKGAYPELTESVKLNSQKAQKIISKMKSERIFLRVLENKINEARGSDDGYDAVRDRRARSVPYEKPRVAGDWKSEVKKEPEEVKKVKENPKQKKFNFAESVSQAIFEGLAKQRNKSAKKDYFAFNTSAKAAARAAARESDVSESLARIEEGFRKYRPAAPKIVDHKPDPDLYSKHLKSKYPKVYDKKDKPNDIKTKDSATSESYSVESLAISIFEGLVKARNKATKKGWEEKSGGSQTVPKNNERPSNSASKHFANQYKDIGTEGIRNGRDALKAHNRATHRSQPKKELAKVEKPRESDVSESLARIEEGTGTNKDKQCLKNYLLSHLQDLQWSYPFDSSKPVNPTKPEDSIKDKIDMLKRLLNAIEEI